MDESIVIVGGGISGLTAAIELERAGKSPVIIEMSDRIGGRVKTDHIEGFQLDRGFQVLLTAYPEVKRYLDLDSLDLKKFEPGAMIYRGDNHFVVADPLRDFSQALPMLMSEVGSLRDKIKTFFLTRKLKKKRIEDIFSETSQSTMQYLKQEGFSDRIIENFFIPFFGGIYLENELRTSSRMFEFVFKMFSEGYAAIPANGMEEIPKQLASQLNSTKVRTDTKVQEVNAQDLVLDGGEKVSFTKLIIASPPNKLLKGFVDDFHEFESVTNLYFRTKERRKGRAMIGLVPDTNSVVNNFCVLSDTASTYAPAGESLVSASVNGPSEKELRGLVRNELCELAGFDGEQLEYLHSYEIPKALPRIKDQSYGMAETEVRVHENIFLAGDFLLNASLNAAMVSGRTAARAVISS